MRVAVVLSTYNWPHALELVLHGYAVQRWRDFHVVVADDGSGPETRAIIEQVRAQTGLRIEHVWHEDRGFRKSEILNRAIVAADADYLVFSDGDTIPAPALVAAHVRYAERGRFLAGGYVKLPQHVSERITVDDVRAGHATRLSWLMAHGFLPPRKALRWSPRPIGALLDLVTPTPARWHGNNASTFRDHLLEVNGFDMEMGYGGQDAALGDRLENFGVRPKRIRHRCIAVHLWHQQPWKDPEVRRKNDAIRSRIQTRKEIRASMGIAELDREER